MRPGARFAALALACLTCASSARAEVALSKMAWQAPIPGKKGLYAPADKWVPGLGRVRLLLTLENRGAITEAAVVVRYAVSVRLARLNPPEKEGTWAVPFLSEEIHLPPLIKPGTSEDAPIPINRVAIDGYLKRFRRLGFHPDALRVQVMLEPKAGESLAGRVSESSIPVDWK